MLKHTQFLLLVFLSFYIIDPSILFSFTENGGVSTSKTITPTSNVNLTPSTPTKISGATPTKTDVKSNTIAVPNISTPSAGGKSGGSSFSKNVSNSNGTSVKGSFVQLDHNGRPLIKQAGVEIGHTGNFATSLADRGNVTFADWGFGGGGMYVREYTYDGGVRYETVTQYLNDGRMYSRTVVIERDDNGDKDKKKKNPPKECKDKLNLRPYSLQYRTEDGIMVSASNLEVGVTYYPVFVMENPTCVSTAQTGNYHDQLPFGEKGSFPIRYEANLDNSIGGGTYNGTYKYGQTVHSVGPLGEGDILANIFAPILFSKPGTYPTRVVIDVDDSDITGEGCSTGWGCINETAGFDDNNYYQAVTVVSPKVLLGSFIKKPITFGGVSLGDIGLWELKDKKLGDRVIATGDDVGLYWDVDKVDVTSCVGTGPGFFGKNDGSITTFFSGIKNVDVNINEPAINTYHVYTITCTTDSGRPVSDTLIISNDMLAPKIDILRPDVSDGRVTAGQTIKNIGFTTYNIGDAAVSSYIYTIQIDGKNVGTGNSTTAINPDENVTNNMVISYTVPMTTGELPLRVCVQSSSMNEEACDSATLLVVVPQCSDAVDNDSDGFTDMTDPGCSDPSDSNEGDTTKPIITAFPTVITQDGTISVSWNPMGYTGCTLSPMSAFKGAVADRVTTDFAITLTNENNLTITCGGESSSIRVRVIPKVFET